MNKLIFTCIALFFLNNCSLNENSRIWKDKENKLETDKKITKVVVEENLKISEFNQDLKLDLSLLKKNNTIKVKINLFTQVSVQAFLCLKPYIWI